MELGTGGHRRMGQIQGVGHTGNYAADGPNSRVLGGRPMRPSCAEALVRRTYEATMANLGKYKKLLGVAGTEAGTTLMGLVSGVLIARHLGADGRGAVTAVMVTLTVLAWLVYFGVPNAAGYMSSKNRSSTVSVAAVLSAVLGALAGIVLWFVAPWFAENYPPYVTTGLRVVSVLLPFVGVAYCSQEIAYAESRMHLWNLLRATPLVLPSIAVVVLALTGTLSVESAIAVYLGSMVVYILVAIGLLVPRLGRGVAWGQARSVFSYALPRWASAASDAVTARMDQVLMVVMSTPAELGRYAVATTAVLVANPLSRAVGVMMYPDSRNADGNSDLALLHKKTRRRSVLLSTASGIVVIAIGAPFVGLVFGPEFEGLRPIMALLVLAGILNDRYVVDISYFAGIGKPEKLVKPSWVTAIVALAGLLLLGRDGLTGVEAASVALVAAAVRCVGLEIVTRRMHREPSIAVDGI